MGCCETRGKIPKHIKEIVPNEKPLKLIEEAMLLNIKNSLILRDHKALAILNHISELEDSESWVSVIEEEKFSATKTCSSKFNGEFIVTILSLRFDDCIPLNLILNSILEIKERMNWDTLIAFLKRIEGDLFSCVVHKKIKVMFYTAEFVEKQVVTNDNESVFVISYSVEHGDAEKSNETRAENIMTCIRITEVNGKTEITLISQTDPKSKFTFLASTLGVLNQRLWIENLKKYICKPSSFIS